MANWTEKAVTALNLGHILHKNNWHAIKDDPRFGPWLVDFSVDDLRDKVKDFEDRIAKVQQTGLNQEGSESVKMLQNLKADPKYGPIFSGVSMDDIKNKFEADLERFGVNLSENDYYKVEEFGAKFVKWKTNEAFALFMGVIKYGKNNWDAIKADPHFGPLLVERDETSCRLKYQHDLDKLESDILTRQQQQQQLAGQDADVPEPVRAREAEGETSKGASTRGKKKGKGFHR